VVNLHCPDCGANVLGQSLDFPAGTAHCAKCRTDFPIETAAVYLAVSAPENITVERTDDSLTMRYVPDADKRCRYVTIGLYYVTILMIIGVLAGLITFLVHYVMVANSGMIVRVSVDVVIALPMCVFWYFLTMDAKKSCFCDWTIFLDANEARIELRCKKHRKTVVIPREKIIEACPNKSENLFRLVRLGRFPEFLWCRDSNGGHFLLDDGTKHYLPLGTTDARRRTKMYEVREWMLAVLNEFLSAHRSVTEPQS
jgi:hypothetical protein